MNGNDEREAARRRMQHVMGFSLDAFQTRALDVMVAGEDVLGQAPTGSGKTALALTAVVLRAFDLGGRAILTTPMKALSNQKYAEFSAWLTKLGHDGRVSLITGDIQARAAPPGGDGSSELLIMTSEILANKLESGGPKKDPDLHGVTVVVMDEVHYINDPSRGHVWERGIMHLLPDIQLVALSATLANPELLCEWMSRRRPTKIVRRDDRHVPLHVGVYDSFDRFKEIYSTLSPHRMTMDSREFGTVIGGDDNKRQLKTTSHHSLAYFMSVVLHKDDKLPAIAFVMSRSGCVEAARGVTGNLLISSRPVPPRARGESGEPDLLEMNAYLAASHAHQEAAANVRSRQRAMYDRYLRPFERDVELLPGIEELKAMLDRGVAYHHAGMLPVLREYVELLFQARLLRVVFATETLGVGINMPARTVVLTRLDKPSGNGSSRPLRPDEFWQMGGRAGRRGMDPRGFVVFFQGSNSASTSSVYRDVQSVLLGNLPPVVSRLNIDPLFVLRRLARVTIDKPRVNSVSLLPEEVDTLTFSENMCDSGDTNADGIIARTLLCHVASHKEAELTRQLIHLDNIRADTEDDELRGICVLEDLNHYRELACPTMSTTGFALRLTPKQRKARDKEISALLQRYGGRVENLMAAASTHESRLRLETDLRNCHEELGRVWATSLAWLVDNTFVKPDGCTVTPKGRASSLMTDGNPLVRGVVVFEGYIDAMDLVDVVAWLGAFTEPLRFAADPSELSRSRNSALQSAYDRSLELSDSYERVIVFNGKGDDSCDGGGSLSPHTGDLLRVWMNTRDVREVCRFIDPSQLGGFVRAVLRVLAFMEELDQVLLGLEKYELHARFRERNSTLLHGVITNRSLYV
jgi:hypothetical protein